MAILKNQLPEDGTVIIEVYRYTDPYKGFGKGKTTNFFKVDVATLEEHPYFKDMVILPDDLIYKNDIEFDMGYDIITQEQAEAKRQELNSILKEIEELKLNLLKAL